VKARRFGRHWGFPRGWLLYFVALGWRGCPHWSHNLTWRDA
jgi:hypothetical protein